jgi:hypothetical protein
MASQSKDNYKLPTQEGELFPPREPQTAEEQVAIHTLNDVIENTSSSLSSVANSLADPVDEAFSNNAQLTEGSPDAETLLWHLYNSIIGL